MTQEHPITPPHELVRQWLGNFFGCTVTGELSGSECYLATQAAHWGADQELEACCEWLINNQNPRWAAALQKARRPKPPSRKQRALDALVQLEEQHLSAELATEIRNALEALPDD
jgi:hypothetical protein